jgi:hypothetical protein
MAAPSEAVSLEQIQDYISYCCCTFAWPNGHREKIVDDGKLMPLARRWQDEIRRRATNYSSTASPYHQYVPRPSRNINAAPSSYRASYQSVSPTPTTAGSLQQSGGQPRYDNYSDRASPPHYPNTPTPSYHKPAFSDPITSPLAYIDDDQAVPGTPEPLQGRRNQPHYDPGPRDTISGNLPHFNLRSREVNGSTNSTPGRSVSDSKTLESEFRIHKAKRGPDDSVARKILAPLVKDDFKTGSLYAFTRDSSPGHVKIGWTASSVNNRLDHWSKHGDEPKILFSVHLVPHARRAETLTHYQLIKEWRRERRCQNQDCNVEHMEWFEVSKYRAKQVVADWAEFIERAEPYDQSDGSLKPLWEIVVKAIDGTEGLVTAKRLLAHYEASLVEEPTLIETSLAIAQPPMKVGSPLPKSKSEDRAPVTPETSPVKALPKTPDQAALSSSPKLNVKAGSDSLPAALKELEDACINLKKEQERIVSITQRLQKIELGRQETMASIMQEFGMQAEPQREVLARDGQKRAEAKEVGSYRQVESPATKHETDEELGKWDADDTLLGDESPQPLEKVTLKTVDGLSAGISAGKAKAVTKGFDGPGVLELKAPPPVGISAQA